MSLFNDIKNDLLNDNWYVYCLFDYKHNNIKENQSTQFLLLIPWWIVIIIFRFRWIYSFPRCNFMNLLTLVGKQLCFFSSVSTHCLPLLSSIGANACSSFKETEQNLYIVSGDYCKSLEILTLFFWPTFLDILILYLFINFKSF